MAVGLVTVGLVAVGLVAVGLVAVSLVGCRSSGSSHPLCIEGNGTSTLNVSIMSIQRAQGKNQHQ